jgi:hypothetical protein
VIRFPDNFPKACPSVQFTSSASRVAPVAPGRRGPWQAWPLEGVAPGRRGPWQDGLCIHLEHIPCNMQQAPSTQQAPCNMQRSRGGTVV